MPKYSIIVPVYKAEKTVEECIESVLKQKINDFELILVDDCSPDNSKEICMKYAQQDARVRFREQSKNKGVSAARNVGLDMASGEYVVFIDSDDFISEDYLPTIDDALVNSPTELLSFGMAMYYQYPGEAVHTEISSMNCNVNGKNPTQALWYDLLLKSFFASPCNKVYQREMIEKYHVRFDEQCVSYEDFMFNCQYCSYIHSFAVIDSPLYYYRQQSRISSAAKRKWKTPFEVSRKVVRISNNFLAAHQEFDLSNIKRHALQSYRIELEAAQLKSEGEFERAVKEVCGDECFLDVIQSIHPQGRFFTALRFAIRIHFIPAGRYLIKRMIQPQ